MHMSHVIMSSECKSLPVLCAFLQRRTSEASQESTCLTEGEAQTEDPHKTKSYSVSTLNNGLLFAMTIENRHL